MSSEILKGSKATLSLNGVKIMDSFDWKDHTKGQLVSVDNIPNWILTNLDFPMKENSNWDVACFGPTGLLIGGFRVKNASENLGGVGLGAEIPLTASMTMEFEGRAAYESEIVRATFNLVGSLVIHEFMEFFKIRGMTVVDPHQTREAEMHITRALMDMGNRFAKTVHPFNYNIQSLPRK